MNKCGGARSPSIWVHFCLLCLLSAAAKTTSRPQSSRSTCCPNDTTRPRRPPLRIMSFSPGVETLLDDRVDDLPGGVVNFFWTVLFLDHLHRTPLKLIHFWHARVIFAAVKLVRRRVSKWSSSWRLMRCDSPQTPSSWQDQRWNYLPDVDRGERVLLEQIVPIDWN